MAFITKSLSMALPALDQILDQMVPLESFLSNEEYQIIYEHTKDWISRDIYLKKLFTEQFGIKREDFSLPFALELFSPTDPYSLFETIAVVPIEFQIIKKENKKDTLIVRMPVGNKKYRIAAAKITDSIKEIIEKEGDTDNSDLAYFRYIQRHGKEMLNPEISAIYAWDEFEEKLSSSGISIEEYSDCGNYLWRRNYQLFDNRAKINGFTYTLTEQLEKQKSEEIENVEVLTAKKKKKPLFPISNFFRDEYGNYWKSEKAYLNYKKFLKL